MVISRSKVEEDYKPSDSGHGKVVVAKWAGKSLSGIELLRLVSVDTKMVDINLCN